MPCKATKLHNQLLYHIAACFANFAHIIVHIFDKIQFTPAKKRTQTAGPSDDKKNRFPPPFAPGYLPSAQPFASRTFRFFSVCVPPHYCPFFCSRSLNLFLKCIKLKKMREGDRRLAKTHHLHLPRLAAGANGV